MSYFTDYDAFEQALEDAVYRNSKDLKTLSLLVYFGEHDTKTDKKEQILMQTLERNGRKYFALRNIVFNEENRGKGRFKKIIELMESLSLPVMVDNIINPVVHDVLKKRGWMRFEYEKNGGKILSMVR